MDAQEARDGLAERAARARRLTVAADAALLDRDAFALAAYSQSGLPAHVIGSYLTESGNSNYHRSRLGRIRAEYAYRLAEFMAKHPDVVIPTY